jgi:hypothetical protein
MPAGLADGREVGVPLRRSRAALRSENDARTFRLAPGAISRRWFPRDAGQSVLGNDNLTLVRNLERLAYVRRAYARWQRTFGTARSHNDHLSISRENDQRQLPERQ